MKKRKAFLSGLQSRYSSSGSIHFFKYLFKWVFLCVIIGVLVGSASAIFLISLKWATVYRESHTWLIFLLPVAGLAIGLAYHYWGKDVVKGNNQLIDEFHAPKAVVPLKMAPLVFLGTVITHLFGGSAGREGTAVQMGGSIADQFVKLFDLTPEDRKILLIVGVSAGFASVFGTPLAGGIFALELFFLKRIRLNTILPGFLAAFIADYVCHVPWTVDHVVYEIPFSPPLHLSEWGWVILAGICFGLAARLFSWATHAWHLAFQQKVAYPPLRPVVGGVFIVVAIIALGTTKYIGLGIPTIVAAFTDDLPPYDFLLKIALTSFTLGAGFKGGEVTPLFFIGATLGNLLYWFIPLPLALLAGMGFVAVFAGASNTPIASIMMGIELFGLESGVYIAIACAVAYLCSGHKGIYQGPKKYKFKFF